MYESEEPFGDRLVASTFTNIWNTFCDPEGSEFVHPWEMLTLLVTPPDPKEHARKVAVQFRILKKKNAILEARRKEREAIKKSKPPREPRKPRGRNRIQGA